MSSGPLVVDDHLLLRILLDDVPRRLRVGQRAVWTTGLWYHRMARALAGTAVTGGLSRSLGAADPGLGARAIAAATALPDSIGLVSLRDLAWPMGHLLEAGARLNLLSLEALAAAEHLGAELCLAEADENPPLLDAARSRGVRIRIV